MKWLRTLILFDQGGIVSSDDWTAFHDAYVRSIASIEHPRGSGVLTLRRRSLKPNGKLQRNGVNYLRASFLDHIKNVEGWKSEGAVDLASDREQPPIRLFPSLELYREPITSKFGGFDFTRKGWVAIRSRLSGRLATSVRPIGA